MDRRDFFKKGIMTTAKVAIGGSIISGLLEDELFASPLGGKRIGLQLYSVRGMMDQNAVDTLKQVAAIGYKELETASYNDGKVYGMKPQEFRGIAEDLGMRVSSAHLGKNIEKGKEKEAYDWWDKALDTQIAAGCTYAVMPSMAIGSKIQDIQFYCDYFNKVGEMANAKGIKFGFHNHGAEFKAVEGKVVMDYLIEHTSPQNVLFEMDVYWIKNGGQDPVEYLKKHAGRFQLLHIKDEDVIGASGDLDFKAIFDAAYKQGMKGYYVEVEKYAVSPIKDVEKSFDYLYHAPFVK